MKRSKLQKFFSIALCFALLAVFTSGCGESPKDVVEDFIEACEDHDFEDAAELCYSSSEGTTISPDDKILKHVAGDETQSGLVYTAMRIAGRYQKFLIGTPIGNEKYWLSPKEAIIDKNNPNKCVVLVFAEAKEKSYIVTSNSANYGKIFSFDRSSKNEVEWDLEKIDGDWKITNIRLADRSYTKYE